MIDAELERAVDVPRTSPWARPTWPRPTGTPAAARATVPRAPAGPGAGLARGERDCGPYAHARRTLAGAARAHGERKTSDEQGHHEGAPPSRADSHDLIRVQGARENNLKDVSVELPKRRLTVFTGVSGSGKSSLVFATIAAESQRMINETYSAFVQGFMPSLARPEVDVLEGLTTAIIVDQERMGANPRSTVGTATDANAMLRILFSRVGKPHIGPPTAFAFNVPTRTASGVMKTEKSGGREEKQVVQNAVYQGGMCPRCEGMGNVSDFDLTALYDESKSLADGALTVPGYSMDGWYGRIFAGAGLPMDKPIAQFTKKELEKLLYCGAGQDQGRGHQPHLRGPDPQDPEVDAVQGRRGDAAARPPVRRARDHLHDLPRLRGHPAHPGSPVVEDQGQEHRRAVPDADQRPRRVDARPRRAGGRPAGRRAAAPARLVRRDRPGLPVARPARGHAVRGRGAAHEDDPPPRLLADRRHLRVRRAHHRAAPARHRADEQPAAPAARQGQHGAGRRAQARDDRDRRPRRRPRARRRHPAAATICFEGSVEGLRASDTTTGHHLDDRASLKESVRESTARARGPGRLDPQPAGRRRRRAARRAVRRDGRRGLRQELADPRVGGRSRTASSSSTRARSAARAAATRRRTPGSWSRSARRSPRPTT